MARPFAFLSAQGRAKIEMYLFIRPARPGREFGYVFFRAGNAVMRSLAAA